MVILKVGLVPNLPQVCHRKTPSRSLARWFGGQKPFLNDLRVIHNTPWYTMIHPVYTTRNYKILQAIWFLQGNQLPVEYSCRSWRKLLLLVSTLLIVHSYLEWWSSICPFNVSLCLSQKGSNHHPFPFHHPSFLIVFASLPYTKSLEKTPAQNSSWLGSQILRVQRSAGLWPDQGWPGSMTGQGWPRNI